MPGVLVQSQGQHQDVRLRQQPGQFGHGKHGLKVTLLPPGTGDAQYFAAEGGKPPGAFAAHTAAADDQHGLSGQFPEGAVLLPAVEPLVLSEKSALLIEFQHAPEGELRHRDAVDPASGVQLDHVCLYVVHRNPVRSRAGELDEAQIRELLNRVMKKQTVADHTLRPIVRAGQRVPLPLQERGLMSHAL